VRRVITTAQDILGTPAPIWWLSDEKFRPDQYANYGAFVAARRRRSNAIQQGSRAPPPSIISSLEGIDSVTDASPIDHRSRARNHHGAGQA